LSAGFDEVEGCDEGVCWAACYYALLEEVISSGFLMRRSKAAHTPSIQAVKYFVELGSILPNGYFGGADSFGGFNVEEDIVVGLHSKCV
jgi:hypothetical protein